jgi:hypothetical protein
MCLLSTQKQNINMVSKRFEKRRGIIMSEEKHRPVSLSQRSPVFFSGTLARTTISSKNYTQKEEDKQRCINDLNLGMVEIRNFRDTQENVMAYSLLAGFERLFPEDQQKVVIDTYKDVQEKCGQEQVIGSTALTCIAYTENYEDRYRVCFITAHLGNSSAFVIVRNKNTRKAVSYMRLNRTLHMPTDPKEMKRITENGGKVVGDEVIQEYPMAFYMRGKLNGELPISRSLGNTKQKGVSHVPDIYFDTIELAENEEIILVVACYSLTKNTKGKIDLDCITEAVIEVKKNKLDIKPDELAAKIVEKALDDNSGESMAVGVKFFSQVVQSAEIYCVFEGNNGKKVAFDAAEHFVSALLKHDLMKRSSVIPNL